MRRRVETNLNDDQREQVADLYTELALLLDMALGRPNKELEIVLPSSAQQLRESVAAHIQRIVSFARQAPCPDLERLLPSILRTTAATFELADKINIARARRPKKLKDLISQAHLEQGNLLAAGKAIWNTTSRASSA
ncbi:MAG: hypothetical protein ACYDBV_14305 [Nitrospiria bacterium]